MQKVVDYKLVRANSPDELTSAVKAAMDDSWVPSGIVVHFKDDIVQAMVKFEEA